MKKTPTMLMILDGYGINPNPKGNAIAQAHTPRMDRLFQNYPGTQIACGGEAVGLPSGQMGNSEVGHLNIGAGRVIYQELSRISLAIKDQSFFKNQAFLSAIDHVKKHNSALHLLGLVSDGGVHSHIDHLIALIRLAKDHDISSVYVHCFLDGRDVPPRCAETYISTLEEAMSTMDVGRIATISGRYYAMDRDQHWERIQQAYVAMVERKGHKASSAVKAIEEGYQRDENDEFLTPTVVAGGKPVESSDALIMFNFRPDRAREITKAFVLDKFPFFHRPTLKNLFYVTMTQYEKDIPRVVIAYPPESYKNTLGEYLSRLELQQLRIAETEKYAHVTFFFNGGVESPNPGEDRILVPSPQVATFDLKPEMSAFEVTKRVLEEIEKENYDFIVLNYANADMVGHTGNMKAAIKAIEALDSCVPNVVEKILEKDGQLLITADHGNADQMFNEQGETVTAHSLNPVPLYYIGNRSLALCPDGKLCDLAPTLLDMMNLPVPEEMTGKSLLLR